MIYEIQIAFALFHMLSNDEFTKSNFISRCNFKYIHLHTGNFQYLFITIMLEYWKSIGYIFNRHANTPKRVIVSRVNTVLKPNVTYSLIQTSISIKSYIQYSIAPLFAHNVWNRTNESQEARKHNNSNPQRFREVAFAHEFIAVVI